MQNPFRPEMANPCSLAPRSHAAKVSVDVPGGTIVAPQGQRRDRAASELGKRHIRRGGGVLPAKTGGSNVKGCAPISVDPLPEQTGNTSPRRKGKPPVGTRS